MEFFQEGSTWPEVQKTAEEHQFFHWDLEFPDIFYEENGKRKKNAGFDSIVGNPPWQILKPDIDEFFGPIHDRKYKNKKFRRLSKAEKNKFIEECLRDKEIKKDYELYVKWYKKQMGFFKDKSFKLQKLLVNNRKQFIGLNLYQIFLEKSLMLLNKNGLCGLVIPSGIYSDLGSKTLRKILLESTEIKSLHSFINRKKIFENIHGQFKFCILVFKNGKTTDKFLASFYNEDKTILENHKNAYKYDAKIIKIVSPDSFSFLECKNESEFKIFEKLYKHPLLGSDKWNFKAKTEFNMTTDANLFHTTDVGYPLYEGKMINMFTHVFANPRYWIREDGIDLLKKKELRKIKKRCKDHHIQPRIDFEEYRLAWRIVTNSTNKRTLISTILPPNVFLGHSLNYLEPLNFDGSKYARRNSNEEMLFLCAMFSSFPADFLLRHKVVTNLATFHLMELPIPIYDETNNIHKKLVENTRMLICTTSEYSDLRDRVKIPDNIEDRVVLESQINALSAKICGLTRHDLNLILKNFPIVDEKFKEMTCNEFDLIK